MSTVSEKAARRNGRAGITFSNQHQHVVKRQKSTHRKRSTRFKPSIASLRIAELERLFGYWWPLGVPDYGAGGVGQVALSFIAAHIMALPGDECDLRTDAECYQ